MVLYVQGVTLVSGQRHRLYLAVLQWVLWGESRSTYVFRNDN